MAGESEGSYSTCDSMADSIRADLIALPKSSRWRCIYRVPKPLRDVNKEAYTPVVVSIGPFHYKDERFLDMEVNKLKYVQSFLHKSEINTRLNTFLRVVKDRETRIRESYANSTTHISSDEFTRMIFIDSVFIIELFRRVYDHSLMSTDDHLWGNPCIISPVIRDLQLIENQLPFFILKELYKAAFKPRDYIGSPYFTDLACHFFALDKSKIQIDGATNEATCCHLIDLQRSCCVPIPQSVEDNFDKSKSTGLCPTATTLYESGVKFQVVESNKSNWNQIQYDRKNRILIIPKYKVSMNTESISRNMLAFEQCHYWSRGGKNHIVDFQRFFNCLIDTPEDVQVLVKAGIIENWRGTDKEVSDMFKSQGDHTFFSSKKYTYASITEQLNSHCNKRWNRYKAILHHEYFNHPWAVIFVIYALTLLILTLIQVVTGIIGLMAV